MLAQRYVANPLLIGGRKFGVRLWVLVTGHAPYRAYLSDRGLVLFSTEGCANCCWSLASIGVAAGCPFLL